jgi:probable O-glycosylation ligase (exosortase A-associated)
MFAALLTYALTFAGSVVSLCRPYVGFLIYVAFSIIRPDALWSWSIPPGNYSRIVAIGLLAGWVLRGFGDWRLGRSRGVARALVGFFIWSIVGAMQVQDPSLATGYVESLAKIVVPALVGLTLIDSSEKLHQLAWTILLSAGCVAFEFNVSYLKGYNRIREEGLAGLDNNSTAILLDSCVGLAIFLGLGARAWWQKAVATVTALMLMHAVLLSNSRGGMLALIATGFVSFLLMPKRAWHYVAFALIGLLGLRMAGPEVRDRFVTLLAKRGDQDGSMRDRRQLLLYAFDSIQKRPVFGVGPDQWNATVRQEYGVPKGKATEVHNTWVQIAAELGVPGAAMILAFYGLCVLKLLPLARAGPDEAPEGWGDLARMVVASLFGSVLASSFVTVEAIESPYYICVMGAGLLKLSPMPHEEACEYE